MSSAKCRPSYRGLNVLCVGFEILMYIINPIVDILQNLTNQTTSKMSIFEEVYMYTYLTLIKRVYLYTAKIPTLK